MKRFLSFIMIIMIICSVNLTGCGKVQVEEIIISDKNVSIQLRDTYQLTAKVSPNNAAEPMIYWESTDNKVVTVKSGFVSAVGEGEAIVKAFTKNDIVAECKFKVENILTKKLTLNKESFTMMLGSTQQVHYTIEPENVTDNAIDWESSDIDVAVVDKGKVTAKGIGTCTITATSTNGVKASCKLTVKVKPTGVKMKAPVATVPTGKKVKLSASVVPASTAYKGLTWETSDDTIATVDDKGVVTGISAGTCRIYATSYNNKYDYCKLTVTQSPLHYKGKGNKTINNLSVAKGVYAITLTHKGDGIFKVIGSDGDGNAYTYASVKGKYTGTNLYANGKNDGVKNATISIAATGEWILDIKAITEGGTDNIEGDGECVTPMFQGTNKKTTVTLHNEENGEFTVFLFDNNGKQIAVMCDEFDNFDGSVKATLDKNKFYFLVVKSAGKWKIDFNNKSKKTVVKSTNK